MIKTLMKVGIKGISQYNKRHLWQILWRKIHQCLEKSQAHLSFHLTITFWGIITIKNIKWWHTEIFTGALFVMTRLERRSVFINWKFVEKQWNFHMMEHHTYKRRYTMLSWLYSSVTKGTECSLEYVNWKSRKYSGVRASLIAQLVKNLPVMQETLVWFLGQEDALEKW